MTTPAALAHRAAFAAQQSLRGESVVFARGDDISVEISNVVRGRTEWKGFGRGGMVVISESVDFLIPAAALVDGDTRLIPLAGDTLRVTVGDTLYTFDVQPFGPDALLWRWHDRGGRSIRRIFTKLYSEES